MSDYQKTTAELGKSAADDQGDADKKAAMIDCGEAGRCLFISPLMRRVRKKIDLSRFDEAPILMLGPPGSGKSIIARAAHALSRRRDGPVFEIECAGLSEDEIARRIFGSDEATLKNEGLLERARGGTLIISGIEGLSRKQQAMLIGVIDGCFFYRVGGWMRLETDARIIAATRSGLDEMVCERGFREELLDRMRWRVRIPSLEHRREDIIPLAEEFIRRYGGGRYTLSEDGKEFLLKEFRSPNIIALELDVVKAMLTAKAEDKTAVTAKIIAGREKGARIWEMLRAYGELEDVEEDCEEDGEEELEEASDSRFLN